VQAIKQVKGCAIEGQLKQCKVWNEVNNLAAALKSETPEALWKVCCDRAYKVGGYQNCANPNARCMAALKAHVFDYVKDNKVVEVN